MNFEDALHAMRLGKIVKRKNWIYPYKMNMNIIYANGEHESKEGDAEIAVIDIVATDWEIV